MDMRAEYLVVGAGVAGCTLSYLLRRQGCDVLVLELRDAKEKDKLCGGALAYEALDDIRDIFGGSALDELSLSYPSCVRARCMERETVHSVSYATLPRKRLDDWLLARCRDVGVELRDRFRLDAVDEQTHVATCVDLRSGKTEHISYGTLIGADGASSAVRRLLDGHKQRVAVALEGFVPPTSTDCVFAYLPAQLGYCWHIPAAEGANVGCMLHESSVEDCRSWLASFCKDLGVSVPRLRGAPIPTGDDVLLHAGRDAWLVGDAAGLARPTDGGGIMYALSSARMLATSLLGGTPYQQAMQPLVESLAQIADGQEKWFLLNALRIAQRGHLWVDEGS